MSCTRLRVWLGDSAAAKEALVRLETVEVTQEMDAMWEARVQISTELDRGGRWKHRLDEIVQPFARVRIEVEADDALVPLIDGPVVRFETSLDSQPGRSEGTLLVRDDSVFLHRDEEVEIFENRSDSDVADEVFRQVPQIRDTLIDPTEITNRAAVRRGTRMQFLRQLARENNRHAFVVPGPRPGESIGCFLADPEGAPGLPELLLTGRTRTLAEATVHEDFEAPETTVAQVLRIGDQRITAAERRLSELVLMNDAPHVDETLAAQRLLLPRDNIREDARPAVDGQARRNSYAIRISSRVVPNTYPAVLSPYRKVPLIFAQTPYSGDYLITKVIHRLTRSIYTQEFEAESDSLTDIAPPGATGAIF